MPSPRGKVRRLLATGLLVAGGAIAALALLELLLTVHNPLGTRIKGRRIVLETNRTYTFQSRSMRGLDPEVTVHRNSVGFRGPDPPPDLERFLSLVTIGGSTTQCMYLSEDETWPSLIGRALARSFRSVWVDNAGLDGHSTVGHRILLEDHVVPLRPKVVLFLLGINDLAVDSVEGYESENVKAGIRWGSPRTVLKSLAPYSETISLALTAYRTLAAYREGLTHDAVDLTRQGYLDSAGSAVAGGEPDLRAFAERERGLIEVCRRAGIEPVLLTQPLLVGSGADDVTGVDLARVTTRNPRENGAMLWHRLEHYNDVTRTVGRDEDVLVIDLARRLPKTSRFFYDFTHFTRDGAAAVAQIASTALCPILRARYPEFATAPCASAGA
jgi:hypothetical protein